MRLFENILVAKFGAKIRRWGLKTENDLKKDAFSTEATPARNAAYYSQSIPATMKKLVLALLLGFALLACSKSDDNNTADQPIPASQVPSSVMTAFNTRYPSATGQIEWELEHGNVYKVKFYLGTQRWQAQFTAGAVFIDEQKI